MSPSHPPAALLLSHLPCRHRHRHGRHFRSRGRAGAAAGVRCAAGAGHGDFPVRHLLRDPRTELRAQSRGERVQSPGTAGQGCVGFRRVWGHGGTQVVGRFRSVVGCAWLRGYRAFCTVMSSSMGDIL